MTSYEPMIYGSGGTIVIRGDGSELWLADEKHMNGTKLRVPALKEGYRNSAEYFIRHIRSGEPISGLCGADVGMLAQEVLEAGILSAAEGRTISLPLPVVRLA